MDRHYLEHRDTRLCSRGAAAKTPPSGSEEPRAAVDGTVRWVKIHIVLTVVCNLWLGIDKCISMLYSCSHMTVVPLPAHHGVLSVTV